MLNRFYLITSLAVVAVYALALWNGWEFRSGPRQTLPAEMRQAPGGYRSFHFWHDGYQGGK